MFHVEPSDPVRDGGLDMFHVEHRGIHARVNAGRYPGARPSRRARSSGMSEQEMFLDDLRC